MTKRCRDCGASKPVDQFYVDSARADGRRAACKECELARKHVWYRENRERAIETARAWQARNPERHREIQDRYNRIRRSEQRAYHLKRTFGLTLDDYDELLADQGGRCAICGRQPTVGTFLHVDHDHETGRVRGLLCFRCNGGLGQFAEDSERLAIAAEYLDGSLEPRSTRRLHRGMAVARARSLAKTPG